jgi:hypothetical protein
MAGLGSHDKDRMGAVAVDTAGADWHTSRKKKIVTRPPHGAGTSLA